MLFMIALFATASTAFSKFYIIETESKEKNPTNSINAQSFDDNEVLDSNPFSSGRKSAVVLNSIEYEFLAFFLVFLAVMSISRSDPVTQFVGSSVHVFFSIFKFPCS